MTYILVAITCLILGALVTAFVCGSKKQDDDLLAAGNELDALRLDFMEVSQSQVLYNDELKSWGVLSADGRFAYSAPGLRGALDGARHRVPKGADT